MAEGVALMTFLGLDIGGANLKAAQAGGPAWSIPFELWKRPADLAGALRELLATLPAYQRLAVTMTGELCDCFESKRQGVQFILGAVAGLAAGHERERARRPHREERGMTRVLVTGLGMISPLGGDVPSSMRRLFAAERMQ